MDFKAAASAAPLVPGRACGSCTMCCKVFTIAALGKPEGAWCPNCVIGSHCTIYPDRPQDCRHFECLWRTDPSVPDSWKPNVARMVATQYPKNGFIYVQVDSAAPGNWRKEPYLSTLKRWAEALLPHGRHVLVFVRDQATLIMPTGPVPLGPMSPDDGFTVRRSFGGAGYTVERSPRAGG